MKHPKLSNYEAERNNLIEIAERFADAIAGPEPSKTSKDYRRWVDSWNRIYHSEMSKLALLHKL